MTTIVWAPGDLVVATNEGVDVRLAGFTIRTTNDTDYRCIAGRVAGTGSEWDASWVFVPEPPPIIRHVTIEFTVNGEPTGKSCRVQLD